MSYHAKYYIQNYDGKYYVPELGLKKKQLKHVDKHFCSYKPKRWSAPYFSLEQVHLSCDHNISYGCNICWLYHKSITFKVQLVDDHMLQIQYWAHKLPAAANHLLNLDISNYSANCQVNRRKLKNLVYPLFSGQINMAKLAPPKWFANFKIRQDPPLLLICLGWSLQTETKCVITFLHCSLQEFIEQIQSLRPLPQYPEGANANQANHQ